MQSPYCRQESSGNFMRASQAPISLNLNESPYGVPTAALEAARNAVRISSRYQFELVEQLRQDLADQHQIPNEWISLYPGSNRALHYATLAFTNAQKPLVVGAPGFPVCEQAARLHERPVCQIPLLADGEHNVSAMLEAGAGGLIYVANPNNPTGSVTPHDALLRLIHGAANLTQQAVVLVDEAYVEFSDEPSMIAALREHPNLVVTRTFSKIYGLAGLRIGYAVAQPELLNRIHTQPAHDVPAPAAAAALACLADEAECTRRKHATKKERQAFTDWLGGYGLRHSNSHSNCLLIDCQRPVATIIEELAQLGVKVGRSWPGLDKWVRITLGTTDEMHILRQALAQVLNLERS